MKNSLKDRPRPKRENYTVEGYPRFEGDGKPTAEEYEVFLEAFETELNQDEGYHVSKEAGVAYQRFSQEGQIGRFHDNKANIFLAGFRLGYQLRTKEVLGEEGGQK